jgi:hypothetical protein
METKANKKSLSGFHVVINRPFSHWKTDSNDSFREADAAGVYKLRTLSSWLRVDEGKDNHSF